MNASRTAFVALLLAGAAYTSPAFANDGVRMGDNNRVTVQGDMNGGQGAYASGVNANAQNSVGSILSGRGVRMGDNNTISATGRMNGLQAAAAVGVNSNAQNSVGSIVSGAR